MTAGSDSRPSGQLARGSALGSIALALGYLAQYLFQVSVSRVLGPEAAGALFVAFAFILLVSIVTRMGLDKTGLKVVAIHCGDEQWSSIRALALLLWLVVGASSAAAAALVFSARGWLTGFLALPVDTLSAALISLSIPPVALALMDFAVNSGPRRAVKTLQRLVDVDVDGKIGNETIDATIEACARIGSRQVAEQLVTERGVYLTRLGCTRPGSDDFLVGWIKRIRDNLRAVRGVGG